jgi:hypothetical protein
MTHEFEYVSYDDADRIAILENKAAELERRLLAAIPPAGTSRWANVALPDDGYPPADADLDDGGLELDDTPLDYDELDDGELDDGGLDDGDLDSSALYLAGLPSPRAAGERDDPDPAPAPAPAGSPTTASAAAGASGRTEALLTNGRQRARTTPARRLLAHWRLVAVGAVALVAGLIAALIATGGGSASWPASVSRVQAQITQACQNPDVAAEPSGLNFSCAQDTQQVLWVFSLLTSGNNPGFVDRGTGRKGLEPITAAQGGDIAWSLNLHHPYSPASPLDSLQVAARAVNNIISGATLTNSSGGALVEAGLESKAANCQRYTGSPKLVTKAGYPARCATPVTSDAGRAALVTDVFQQWMGGTPSTLANEAGVLFTNADNPGDQRVQAILATLPASGS